MFPEKILFRKRNVDEVNREIKNRNQSKYVTEKRERKDEGGFPSQISTFSFAASWCEARTHFLPTPIPDNASSSCACGKPTCLLGFADCCRSLRKFETDFSVLEFQIRRERSSAFRDEAFEKIGFSGCEKLLRLFFGNLASEDHFAHVSAQNAAPNEAEIQMSLCLFSAREQDTRRSYCRASKRNFRSKATFRRTPIPSLRPP